MRNVGYIDENAVRSALAYQGLFNLLHNETVTKIDFVIQKKSLHHQNEFVRRRKFKLDNTEVWVVSLEDLILAKLDWAKDSESEMQLRDITGLLEMNPSLDLKYLEEGIQKLGLTKIFKKVEK